MLRIDKLLRSGHRLAGAWRERAVPLVLPYGDRCRSRLLTRLADGTEAGLFLPRGVVLRTGTMLVAEDGRLVRIEAAAQPVLEVTSPDPLLLMRAAYHLGNRHTPVQISLRALWIERDPVLADMLRRLGLRVDEIDAAFEPEAGAYGGGHRHGHDESFEEDYALAQAAFAHHHGGDDRASSEPGASLADPALSERAPSGHAPSGQTSSEQAPLPGAVT
ncbi:MAG: urease accessory protein UreE [Burkholderiaceae bacterium]